MQELVWKQKRQNVFITIELNEKKIMFKLDERLIIHLIGNSPKVYFLTVNLEKESIQFLANFTDLKPVIKTSGKLKLSIKTSTPKKTTQVSTFGNYTIARGESFYERFLGVEGWQAQKYLFNLIPLDQKDVVKEIKETKTQPTELKEKGTKKHVEETVIEKIDVPEIPPIKETEQKSKFLECPKCQNIISTDFDICPHCFNSIVKIEEEVDLII